MVSLYAMRYALCVFIFFGRSTFTAPVRKSTWMEYPLPSPRRGPQPFLRWLLRSDKIQKKGEVFSKKVFPDLDLFHPDILREGIGIPQARLVLTLFRRQHGDQIGFGVEIDLVDPVLVDGVIPAIAKNRGDLLGRALDFHVADRLG